ncbi:MAG: hypothetical protein OXG13_17005 [Gemmatimonadaceae bacterium]|nr:hypothetical protein [Gemmatimonadaceae bacterium]
MAPTEVSLFDSIKGIRPEAVILTTYSCHFPYFEQVILRRLRRAGIRQVVLLIDQEMLAQAVEDAPPRRAGRDYALIPVARRTAFHPKVVLLGGSRGGVLSVGSHNLTLAGYSWNKEVATLQRSVGASAPDPRFRDAWEAVKGWMLSSTVCGYLCEEELAAFENALPWLHDSDGQTPDARVLIAGGDRSIWEQVTELIDAPVERVTVVGAFFDSRLQFVERIARDLGPIELIIGVDPQTVSAPPTIAEVEHAKLVAASQVWGFEARYLHAKCLLVEDIEGSSLLVTGSANPSRSAWLERGERANVEMVLLQTGRAAKEGAESIGLGELRGAPEVSAEELQTISRNWDRGSEAPRTVPEVAVVAFSPEDPAVALVAGQPDDILQFLDSEGREVLRQLRSEWTEDGWTPRLIEQTHMIRVWRATACIQAVILQRQDLIADVRRPPEQRQFREALGSLATGEPKLSELFGYIERLIGNPELAVATPGSGTKDDRSEDGLPLVGSRGRKRRRLLRIRDQDNLGYLLDVLMRELGRDLLSGGSKVDVETSDGRTEEELIGQEDEEVIFQRLPAMERRKLLEVCHRRVRRLVKRMSQHLEQFRHGEEPASAMLMRLVAVLGMAKVLRDCDEKAEWVPRGQTAFPSEQRWQLLREILANIIDGRRSLATSDVHDQRILQSEEWTQVRAYVLWLAFYCECVFRPHAAKGESEDECRSRIWRNAVVFALASLIGGSDDIIERASDLIGDHPDRDWWLEVVSKLDVATQEMERPDIWDEPGGTSGLQVAAHMSGDRFLPRLVYEINGDRVSMTSFARESGEVKYESHAICTASLGRLVSLRELERDSATSALL